MTLIERGEDVVGLLARLALVAKARVEVGIIGARGSRDDEIDNVRLGTIHEFGSSDGHVPERSFLRSTLSANGRKYERILRTLIRRFGDDPRAFRRALEALGQKAVGDVQQRIADGIPPPNRPSTEARKGSSKPLIDTGQLRRSITHRVTS